MRLKYINTLILIFSLNLIGVGQTLRDTVKVTTSIFTVLYSEVLEQPLSLTYISSNRPKNIKRKGFNFYPDPEIHTSDNADYYKNIWDRGHLAPAATFSDTRKNLKQTFTFLNIALQHERLNQGQWRLLEQQERIWDDEQDLTITIDLEFTEEILPTSATLPKTFIKHVYFTKDKIYKCYEFPNKELPLLWYEYQVIHEH